MPRNSHNATIDETAKPWSGKFKDGKNAHGQTWEDIFGTPEHPMLEQKCDLCGHSLTNNSHGIDQNDVEYDGERWQHTGFCTYCHVCNPALFEADESDSVKAHTKEHESAPDKGDQVQAVQRSAGAGLQLPNVPAGEEGNERQGDPG